MNTDLLTIFTAVVVWKDGLRGPSVKTTLVREEAAEFAQISRLREDVESATVHATYVPFPV